MASFATTPYGGYTPVQGPSWTAIFALVIAVIAIIVILVVVWIFTREPQLVTNQLDRWSVVAGGTSSQAFTAIPNSVFVVPANAAANYTVTINTFSGFESTVTSAYTTMFRIDNSQHANPVTLTPNPVDAGTANPGTVPARSVYEYHWLPDKTYKLISWSKA